MENNIKKLRKGRGMTQEELAKSSGITINWLSKIENGKSNPSIQTLAKIANSLGVSLRDIF